MKKSKFKNIGGSIMLYLSISLLSIAINLPILAVLGLVIAPVAIIYFNKKYTVKSSKYYAVLAAAILVMFIVVGVTSEPTTKDVGINNNDISIEENNEEPSKDKEDTTIEDNNKEQGTVVDKDKAEDKEVISDSVVNKEEPTSNNVVEDLFAGYKLIEVDGGNLSGHREANVVVDIGFGDREYWAFTNEYGQLVKVIAKEIILQDDATEPVKSNGRYYNDEAKVPGTESKDLDEGHVIADSLGGVSNAYNITPQNSTLNRHGDQAYMEKVIRQAGGCTDFVAIITYPDTKTQIPSHYSYTYTINGNVINDEFDNINPEEYNASLDSNTSNDDTASSSTDSNNTASNTPEKEETNNSTINTPSNTNNSEIVYWTPNGKSYHTRKSCSTLSRSKTILEGTIQESGKDDPCDRCH